MNNPLQSSGQLLQIFCFLGLMNQTKIKKNQDNCYSEYLANNLLRLLDSHKINGSELARNLEIPYNTIHRIINGVTSDPRLSTLQQIADYFGVSIDFLIGNEEENNSKTQIDSLILPVLTWDYIQNPNFMSELDRETWSKWLPVSQLHNEKNLHDLFAIESTKSMQPRFPLGTTFIVKINESLLDGDLVFIRFKDDSISLRELVIDSPIWQLNSIISGSSSLIFDAAKHTIFGVVCLTLIQTRQHFK